MYDLAMNCRDRDEVPDPRYEALRDVIPNVAEFDLRELDAWLSSESTTRLWEKVLVENFETASHSEKIQTTTSLKKASLLLANAFQLLGLPPSLEDELFRSWTELGQLDKLPPGNAGGAKEWEAGKERLITDLQLFIKVAEMTEDRLKARGGKRGRPSAPWRNRVFSELVRRLGVLLRNLRHADLTHTARRAWNVYFPKNQIMDDDAALKLIQRQKQRQTKT